MATEMTRVFALVCLATAFGCTTSDADGDGTDSGAGADADGGGSAGGDGAAGTDLPWSAWISANQAAEFGPDAGLLADRPNAELARLPTRTVGGHPIDVDLAGTIRFTPPDGFWGPAHFDYQLDGQTARGTINVAPAGPLPLGDDAGRRLLTGWGDGDGFGSGTINVGDLDGDGDDELAVLAPGFDGEFGPSISNHGAVVVVPGYAEGDFAAGGNWLAGSRSQQRIGTRACGAGDLDGDGRGELVATGTDDLYVIRGPADLQDLAAPIDAVPQLLSLTGVSSGATQQLVCGLDLVGDASPDIIMAGWEGVFVVDGSLRGDHHFASVGQPLPGIDWTELQAEHVRRVRDLDGDGAPELAVAVRASFGARVLVRDSSDASWRQIGTGVIGPFDLGDVNGDGRVDLAVAVETGVRLIDDAFGDAEVATFVFAEQGWTRQVLLRDFDGDGLDDLLAAIEDAPRPSDGVYGHGEVVLWFGESDEPFWASLVNRHDFALWGPQSYAGYGRALPALGDFDGDGVPDLAFGLSDAEFTAEQSQSGAAGSLGAVVLVPGFGPARPTPLSPH